MDENRIRQIFKEELTKLFGRERFNLSTDIKLEDGRDIITGRTVGTKIGTAADQKIGFFGHAPVIQQATPTNTATIIALLQALGLSA